MGGMRINFAEVENSFSPVPEGRYEAIIEFAEVRESKSSDNDYLNFEFKMMDDEHEGRKQWLIRSLSSKALPMLKDMLVELGLIDPDDEIDLEWEDDVDITPQEGPRLTNPQVEGIACIITIKNEVYDGRERNKVVAIEAADSPGPTGAAKSSSGAKSGGSAAKGGRRKLR